MVGPIASIKKSLETLTLATVRIPFGVGDYPTAKLDFFHWGAFAEPTLWGIVYGAWQAIAASVVAMLLPLTVYLVIPEASADSLRVQLGVMAFSGVTSSVARIWVGMHANRFAWARETQIVERVLRGQHRRDVAWYVSRQWRWMLWANVALVVTTVIAAAADYQALAPSAPGPAQFALAQHFVWTIAGYAGAWLVGGASHLRVAEAVASEADRSDSPTGEGSENPTGDSPQPVRLLANEVEMPIIGFGTYKIPPGDETFRATLAALRAGYRHIDTASLYANEFSVGEAIRDFGIGREELFITTKVWNDRQGYAETLDAFDESLQNMGLEYLDLYLVHWPIESTLETTWFALEHLLSAGKVRAIGVCNFDIQHLEALAKVARTAPMVNQIELHPRFQRPDLVRYCTDHGIAVEAWAPLMRGGVFEIPELTKLGERHGKTAGQVALRWGLQSGYVVLPKSVHPERIQENFEVFDFELTADEMAVIGQLDLGQRVGPDPEKFSWRWPESER